MATLRRSCVHHLTVGRPVGLDRGSGELSSNDTWNTAYAPRELSLVKLLSTWSRRDKASHPEYHACIFESEPTSALSEPRALRCSVQSKYSPRSSSMRSSELWAAWGTCSSITLYRLVYHGYSANCSKNTRFIACSKCATMCNTT